MYTILVLENVERRRSTELEGDVIIKETNKVKENKKEK